MALSPVSTRAERRTFGELKNPRGHAHVSRYSSTSRFVTDFGVFFFYFLFFGPGQYTDIDTQSFYITLLADHSFNICSRLVKSIFVRAFQ